MRIAFAMIIPALAVAASAQTVSVSLSSPQAGQQVVGGATINWSIDFSVSAGDNQGLALLITDLVQDAANPAKLDIPIASSVPAGMTNFARPAGVTNPGDGTASLGYRGVQRGAAGQKNLIQIGGAQNTFGTARPAGSGVAESANVVANVGQSGSQLLASGSFAMPSVCGTYVFRLANVGANVLVQRNNPPAFSPVTQPTINASAGTITITVGLVGDLDGNGIVDLTDLTSFLSQFGMSGPGLTADLNGDQVVDLTDLTTFLSAYGQTC